MSKFIETEDKKVYFSDDFNYAFNKKNGDTFFWGKTMDENPDKAPFNMLLDMEITQTCTGIGTYGPCKHCYKDYHSGHTMTLSEAKNIIDKLHRQCTQIAFGTDAKLISNPEWYEIFQYARKSGFIPNVTVADINDETADKLASVCGAVAVSRYHDKDICYNSVKRLTDRNMKQVNIHMLLSKESLADVYELIDDISSDERLSNLNAVVFLSLKQKGRGVSYHSITQDEFSDIVNTCLNKKIHFGFDSCSASKFLNNIKGKKEYSYMKMFVEKCESSCFSFYINAEGFGFPCSFSEGVGEWKTGLDVAHCDDFIQDIWNNPRLEKFRNTLLSNNRDCPLYTI